MSSNVERIDDEAFTDAESLRATVRDKPIEELRRFASSDIAWYSMLVSEGVKAIKSEKKIN